MKWLSHDADETESIGAALGARLPKGAVVTLSGDLGAGKTAFARGVLRGLGYTDRVTSPTFAVANEYQTNGTSVVQIGRASCRERVSPPV